MTSVKSCLPYRMWVAVLLAVAFVWTGSSAAVAQSSRQHAAAVSQRATTLESRLELMLRTMRIARDWHIEAPTKAQLIAGAIEGLLARVDPESELYSRSDLRRVARFMPSGRAGVGLEVRREPAERRNERKGYRVVTARDGSPAARAGLKAGDLITHVDGQPAGDVPYLVMTHAMLDGPAGSSLRLTVERADAAPEAEDVIIERSATFGADLAVDEVAPGIVRIRMTALSEGTAGALARELAALAGRGANRRSMRGLVLDLRSTSAASTEGANAVADAFLQSGVSARIHSRHDERSRPEAVLPGDIVDGLPIAVLVDGGTAGASEVLVSALQEAHRARVVGTKTAGRGAIRTLVALDQGKRKGLLRLTTGRMLTPAGAPIDGKGVTPEIPIEQLPASVRCRTRDIEDVSAKGACVPRTLDQDTQLQRAISTLDEPVVAAQQAPTSASAKP